MNASATNERSLPPAQRFGLSLSGVITAQNRYRFDTLHPQEANVENKTDSANLLARDWGIRTSKDLKEQLASLSDGGGHNRDFMEMLTLLAALDPNSRQHFIESHKQDPERFAQWVIASRSMFRLRRSGICAWDCGRYIMLCRWGAMIGLIEDLQAWELIMQMARAIQPVFSDWYEYGISYATGRCFWLGSLSADHAGYLMTKIKRLLFEENAPWTVDWQTDLSDA